ncbi:ribosomal protein S18 acetylase RimI-like enzyme [Ruminiclostridium sufflavum DSM 19573]|uniref:Ribosomal protein S18 acetylase RimI-like enzyme n=1 Tax=Ruminiclostridium sufflavum DSM 19573 TaxID=1121337 RepID=A0A318XK54_9FIRM|nr:GNAT family N-acetyltransferase [Ruminiclostridium sufflavum]PYG87413.1 ribosomal protein S18 acetylase RimI-like enzyme [Ruminiclostridium sufflavum DSM 19573]
MLDINIEDDTLYIKSINKNSIGNIYSIYRNTYDFSFATGIFDLINYDQFSHQLSKFITRQEAFFLDICFKASGEAIGFVKGSIIQDEKIGWINSLAINKLYQRNGYGQKVMELLEKYLEQHFNITRNYLSVHKNNSAGIKFWSTCGYEECFNLSDICPDKSNQLIRFMYKDCSLI